jgi:hypothetical protein
VVQVEAAGERTEHWSSTASCDSSVLLGCTNVAGVKAQHTCDPIAHLSGVLFSYKHCFHLAFVAFLSEKMVLLFEVAVPSFVCSTEATALSVGGGGGGGYAPLKHAGGAGCFAPIQGQNP